MASDRWGLRSLKKKKTPPLQAEAAEWPALRHDHLISFSSCVLPSPVAQLLQSPDRVLCSACPARGEEFGFLPFIGWAASTRQAGHAWLGQRKRRSRRERLEGKTVSQDRMLGRVLRLGSSRRAHNATTDVASHRNGLQLEAAFCQVVCRLELRCVRRERDSSQEMTSGRRASRRKLPGQSESGHPCFMARMFVLVAVPEGCQQRNRGGPEPGRVEVMRPRCISRRRIMIDRAT